jgi:predicted Rossmann fold nucleotide-binding protein DprA/Smf involved in DNA uptake
VDDVLQELETLLPKAPPRPALESGGTGHGPRFTEDENTLLALIEPEGELDVDSLIRGSGLKASVVSVVLLGLEMKRAVRMLPGQRVGLRRQ